MAGDKMPSSKYLFVFFFFLTLILGVLLGPADNESEPVEDVTVVYKFLVTHSNTITYDTAFVYVHSGIDESVNISIQTTECYQCKLTSLGPVGAGEHVEIQVDTSYPVIMEVTTEEDQPLKNASICNMTHHFLQNGNYTWYINYKKISDDFDCKLVKINNPPNAFIPVFVAIGIFAGLAIFCIVFNQLCNSGSANRFLNYLGMERVVSNDLGTPSNPVSAADSNSIQRPNRDKPKRLKSLDAFRGGYLGPGGPLVGENESLLNCTGGAANYIDKVILTYNHIYQRGTQLKIYQTTVPHDPEGILGTLTSIFMTFLGLQAGKIFHLFSYPRDRILRFLGWCLVTGLIAGALCGFSKEDGIIPVNKNLWSVSFILATASMAFFLLAIFYYLIDVQFWWTGVPFFFVGMNSIAVYCGSEVLEGYFPFHWTPVYNTHAELLAMNIIGVSLWVLISYYMYTINFFVKV